MSKTANELRAEASAHFQQAHDSFERCDTDGFLSQWASNITGQLRQREASLLEAGNVAEFPALFDLDGNWVAAKMIDTRYGLRWALLDERGKFTGKFLPVRPKRSSTLRSKGYTEGRAVWPAKAAIHGTGRGLSSQAWVVTDKACKDHEPPVAVVYVDRFEHLCSHGNDGYCRPCRIEQHERGE